tara:strand:- start:118 stop:330 length:213 start_codon:yes stop_codon:yes gene_type:complete
MAKKICEVCKGNGFVRVPYEIAREEQWADCSFCNNQGEIEVEDETVELESPFDDFYDDVLNGGKNGSTKQ